MSTNEALTIISMFLGPLVAIGVTVAYQNRKERIQAKQALFMDLIAHRKRFPIQQPFVSALNRIDVVFHRDKKVIEAWRKYYDVLQPKEPMPSRIDSCFLNLLDEMAKSLGYRNLKQTTYSDFYTPQQFEDEQILASTYWREIIRLLKASESLGVTIVAPPNPGVPEPNDVKDQQS
jgi:hypothetical protein